MMTFATKIVAILICRLKTVVVISLSDTYFDDLVSHYIILKLDILISLNFPHAYLLGIYLLIYEIGTKNRKKYLASTWCVQRHRLSRKLSLKTENNILQVRKYE